MSSLFKPWNDKGIICWNFHQCWRNAHPSVTDRFPFWGWVTELSTESPTEVGFLLSLDSSLTGSVPTDVVRLSVTDSHFGENWQEHATCFVFVCLRRWMYQGCFKWRWGRAPCPLTDVLSVDIALIFFLFHQLQMLWVCACVCLFFVKNVIWLFVLYKYVLDANWVSLMQHRWRRRRKRRSDGRKIVGRTAI